jgi:hypothetical protein
VIRKATSRVLVPSDRFEPRVLKADFVDVQQGDAAVVETPDGKVMLIDGGENKLFARYLASRFPNTSVANPRVIDCMLVSHGDADHFAGLAEIHASETHVRPRKRLFIEPHRVYHNGLVKRPSSVSELKSFGPTKLRNGTPIVTDLVDDLVAFDPAEMNKPFRTWREALESYASRHPIVFRHLSQGDDDAFGFLADENISVEVLAPILTKIGQKQGLAFIRTPPDRLARGDARKGGAFSASHTVNGHSVVIRLKYGDITFVLAGDLNEPAEEALVAAHDDKTLDLQAEVLKVPHHGSADYSAEFLRRVAPVVSVISSGDENERVEFVHPRATLLGALGRSARPGVAEPVILITELAAFFKAIGVVDVPIGRTKKTQRTFAFSRSAFGIVRMRTDGKRLFVYTDTGKRDQNEAYAFVMKDGKIEAAPVRTA